MGILSANIEFEVIFLFSFWIFDEWLRVLAKSLYKKRFFYKKTSLFIYLDCSSLFSFFDLSFLFDIRILIFDGSLGEFLEKKIFF